MAYPDLEEVRTHYAALRELVIRNPGGWDDAASRQQVKDLCAQAREAIEDAEIRQQLRTVESNAAALFSIEDHLKWARKSMGGADYLRLQILIALEVLNTRLFMIDALRNRAAIAPTQQGTKPVV